MPRLDRTGQTFGKLTVLQDSAESGQLICRCACGREGNYPRTICKVTYRGRRMCAWCAGSPCVVCGEMIPAKPGHPPATCSDACADEHIRRRGKAYYRRVKGTEHWRAVRAAYIAHIKRTEASDQTYAERRRLKHRAAVQRHRAKQTSAQRSVALEARRKAARQALEKIRTSGGYAAYLARHRRWYASLNEADYERIYRRKRTGTRQRKGESE